LDSTNVSVKHNSSTNCDMFLRNADTHLPGFVASHSRRQLTRSCRATGLALSPFRYLCTSSASTEATKISQLLNHLCKSDRVCPVIEISSFYGAQLSRCLLPHLHLRTETVPVSETSCYLEYQTMGKVQKTSNSVLYFGHFIAVHILIYVSETNN
jgi:hypothetical protein